MRVGRLGAHRGIGDGDGEPNGDGDGDGRIVGAGGGGVATGALELPLENKLMNQLTPSKRPVKMLASRPGRYGQKISQPAPSTIPISASPSHHSCDSSWRGSNSNRAHQRLGCP